MRWLYFLILIVPLSGCASLIMEANREEPAVIAPRESLTSKIPEIDGPPITVAVYSFKDLTGQKKSSDRLALFSTAVTQGAEVFLIKSLQESKNWFRVVERVGLDNLIKERQLIRNQREVYEGKDAKPLKPLTVAGIMIEGGIIGYDSNIRSGGNGARWLGIGASQQYRVDEVVISLRLISINSGEILLSTAVSKTIYSTAHNVGVFKFFDQGTRSLELESGAALNEPTTYAVRVAIEQAVYEMIVAGEKKGLWRFRGTQQPHNMPSPVSKSSTKDQPLISEKVQTGTVPKQEPENKLIKKGTVTDWANARQTQNYDSKKIINLQPGSQVEILGEEKDFYRIKQDDKEGWVVKKFITVQK